MLRHIFILFICCLNLFFSISPEEDKVLTLDNETFDDEIKKHQFILVEFYAPWCGHCKSLAPEYSKAAEILSQSDPVIYLAKVDATTNSDLAQKFSVEGFPTLKFLKNGNWYDYDGGRTADDIVNWVKKKSGPVSKGLNSVEEVDNFKKSADAVCVYFGQDESDTEFKAYINVANNLQDSHFAHIFAKNSSEVFKHYNIEVNEFAPQVVLFKNFDEGRNNFQFTKKESDLTHFIRFNSLPMINNFNERSAEAIFSSDSAGILLIRNESQKSLDEVFKPLASKYRGKIHFVITGIAGDIEERLAEFLLLNENDLPQVRIVKTASDEDVTTYLLEKEITQENVDNFISDFFNNKLQPFYKSEEVPKEQTESVYKIVGKTFNEVVMDPKKNVLVMFYAPWCPHCKKLDPEYVKLADHFKDRKDTLIAKMDATANEIPDLIIEGYPTIKFYPANIKNYPIDYTDERDLESLIKFVNNILAQESGEESMTRISTDDKAVIEDL